MLIKYIKNTLYFHKILMIGLIFGLLAVLLFCGNFQGISNQIAIGGTGCSMGTIFRIHANIKNDNILSLFLISFIALGVLMKSIVKYDRKIETYFNFPFIYLKISHLFYKVYNTILEALRRGRLCPQIYNLILIQK